MTSSITEILLPALRHLTGKTGQWEEEAWARAWKILSAEMYDFRDYGCWADEDFPSMLKRLL